ncbi:hypothetical protein SKAU_G00003800 [Synaphobranchus kaupii]|uniref:SCP domain-containing protein n=1 Tax=Synaphobranchus kaupii TaxID=118154 RepID=A0A9Q1JCN5_SYNKA|nr:hypothetical protein SKAU_G00003800 [Synaphobranchus kaupii]
MADASFEKEFLEAHNSYRATHQAPSLSMNRELCKSAQAWADHLLSLKTMKHSNTNNGENLYYAWSSGSQKQNGKAAVEKWYAEVKDYDFSNPGFGSNTGHFTQVVWKDTKELGVGLATDGKTVFVVGQYSPPGNMTNEGYFENNVLPADENFEKEFLEAHNTYRAIHQAPGLSMNRDLCSSAQEWADHLLSIKTMKHSDTNNGENLYYGWKSGVTGHFTQVVWKATKEVGVGLATDGRIVFVVGQYSPPGNMTNPGYFENNVLPAV